MELIKKINLEVDREYYTPIQAQQSDSARSIEFSITYNGLQIDLTDVSVKLVAIKPDGTKVYNDLTVSNNIAKLELTNQLLAVVGKVKCQLQLIKSTDILRTIIFYIDIKESLDVTGSVESTNEFTTLENAITTLNTWNSYFQENSGKIEEKYTARLNTAEDNITSLQTELNTVKNNVSENNTSIDTLNENVTSLQKKVRFTNYIPFDSGQPIGDLIGSTEGRLGKEIKEINFFITVTATASDSYPIGMGSAISVDDVKFNTTLADNAKIKNIIGVYVNSFASEFAGQCVGWGDSRGMGWLTSMNFRFRCVTSVQLTSTLTFKACVTVKGF